MYLYMVYIYPFSLSCNAIFLFTYICLQHMYISLNYCLSLCVCASWLFLLPSDLGQSIFYTTTCLLPFLSDDILSTLPYTMISTLATFPPFLHKDIIEYLSTSFLPMAICEYSHSVSNIHLHACEKKTLC